MEIDSLNPSQMKLLRLLKRGSISRQDILTEFNIKGGALYPVLLSLKNTGLIETNPIKKIKSGRPGELISLTKRGRAIINAFDK